MTYKIKKGKNYCSFKIPRIVNTKKILRFKVSFSSSCLYTFPPEIDSDTKDINKLYGFSFGFNSDKDSIRIGWNCQNKNGKISLFLYPHINFKHLNLETYLQDVEVDKEYTITLICDPKRNKIQVVLDHNIYSTKYPFNNLSSRWGWRLFPYFGGNQKAPHNMSIYIDDISDRRVRNCFSKFKLK